MPIPTGMPLGAFPPDRFLAHYPGLPIVDIARAIQDRAEELGLVWRLRPATVINPGPGGQVRMTYDGDSAPVDAVSLIGRLPVNARVMGMISPPAGNHIVGFLGAEFPASTTGEAIGRPYLYIHPGDSTVANSTTYADVTGFKISIVPRAVYMARLRLTVDAPLTSDVKVRWSAPADAAMERNALGIPSTATGSNVTSNLVQSIRRSYPTDVNIGTFGGAAPGNAFVPHWEDIVITAGPTAGVCQLQAAVVAANGAGVIRQNSTLEVQRYR